MENTVQSREAFYSQDSLVIYREFPEQIRRNFDYKVSVTQGTDTYSIPVYNHTMEYNLLNRMVGGDIYRRFAMFAFSGSQVRVDIEVGFDFKTYSVFPSAKQFKSEYKDGVISVYLDKPDYFGIILDDYTNSILSVIADLPEYPEDIPDRNGENVIFIDTWTDTEKGVLDIYEPNTTVYIAPGAVLNARVMVNKGADGTRILGRGAILDPFEDIYSYDIREGGTEGRGYKMCILAADNCVYDGPVCMDARCFNIYTAGNNISVRNYKVFCTMMTSDGFTTGGSCNNFEHCWIYNGDNGIVVSCADRHVYRDITIGTTCKALFPQLYTTNIFMENIYVFRADEAIITNVYNNIAEQRDVSITVNNLDCIDCVNLNSFFHGRNMGTLPKHISFNNINLPVMSGSSDPHTERCKGNKNCLIAMKNPEKLFTENYTLDFNNLYIGGKAVESFDEVYVNREFNNTYNLSNDGAYAPASRDIHAVDHKACGLVYVGSLRVPFNERPMIRNGELLLPAYEAVKCVRGTNKPKTVEIEGREYIKSSDLPLIDTVGAVEMTGSDLRITMAENTGNLLAGIEGRISRISEDGCYMVDMVVEQEEGENTYVCYSHSHQYRGGASIMLTPEIKMYGAGEYTFSFEAKGEEGVLNYSFKRDNKDNYYSEALAGTINGKWQSFEIKYNITEEMLGDDMFIAVISGTTMEKYSLKNFTLTKRA